MLNIPFYQTLVSSVAAKDPYPGPLVSVLRCIYLICILFIYC
jgi:hypothetical protein